MNNSWIQEEKPTVSEMVHEEEAKKATILEAIQEISRTKAWSTLKTEVFDKSVRTLNKDLLEESKKANPDTNRLNRIAGSLEWSDKYDLSRLEESYKFELQRIRTNHGQ